MSYLHDATPTWNGFNYQGKVALCVVLSKLLEIGNNPVNEYFLELEWLEDFAIKKNDEYETIHQVKNYGKDTLPDFKSALNSLLVKVLHLVPKDELKYAITKQKVDKDVLAGIILTDLKNSNIITANDKIVLTADFNNLGLSNGVLEYGNRLKDKLIQLAQIANHSGGLQKCFLHIAEPLNGSFDAASIKLLDSISPYSAQPGFDDAIDKMELYPYSVGIHNCNNLSIVGAIEERIKRYLIDIRGFALDSPECQNENITKIRHYLLNVIDKNVSDRHQDIRDGNANTIKSIPFLDFKEIFDSNDLPTNNYYHAFHLKEAFGDTLNDALILYENDNEKCQILLDLADNIYQLYPKDKFIEFCLKIRPHVIDPKKMHTLHNDDGLRDSFFKFFTDYLKYDNAAFVKTPQNDYSLITTISEQNFTELREKIVYKKIKENEKELPPLLFNVNTLVGNIGAGKGGKKFSDVIPKATTADADFLDKLSSSKITISEDFKIVDISDEINRLNPPQND